MYYVVDYLLVIVSSEPHEAPKQQQYYAFMYVSAYIMYTAQLLRYYFGSTGKAYRKSYGKTINGKKYGFDEDGKMLFGYVEENSYNIINDDEDPILNATYYYGTNEDGARHSGWLQYTDALADKDDDYYWFYFNTSNGKKVVGTTKNINGKKYSFDSQGVMNFKWSASTKVNNQTLTSWYGKLEDGSLAKNQWIWNKPYDDAVINAQDVEDETERWFRTDASGQLVKAHTKKINGKWYAFDEEGVMKTGLIKLSKASVSGAAVAAADCHDLDDVTRADIATALTDTCSVEEAGKLHYFSDDEEKDGSMKTGTMKLELADDEYTFCFAKTTGAAKHGFDSSSKKVYNNGILLKAGDDRYCVVEDTTNGKHYLVGSTGNIVKAVNKYKDANDAYFIIGKDGKIYYTTDEEAAKKAVKADVPSTVSGVTEAPATK